MKTTKCCSFCKSEEGKPRPVGNYIVELKVISVMGSEKYACQSCYRKTKRLLELEHQKNQATMKPSIKTKMHQFGLRIAGLFVMFLFTSAMFYAQGTPGLPMFPDEPAAAPIDGGLSLLAAAGGAYAIKKLKDKRAE